MSIRSRGFTLLEAIVALSIFALVGLVLTQVLSVGQTAQRKGSKRMEVHRRVRETVRRLRPLVTSAMPPTMVEKAIYHPDVGQSDDNLVFISSHDHLGAPASEGDVVVYHLYRLRLDGTDVVLEKMADPATPADDPPARVLGRRIDGLQFAPQSGRMVVVTVTAQDTVRDATGQQQTVPVTLSTRVELPVCSYR